MTYDGPLSVLCDTHAIPILIYIEEHGRCIKSDIYREVARHANMPKKIDALADSGLIEMEPKGDGRTTTVLLTDMGGRVVMLLRDIEAVLSAQ